MGHFFYKNTLKSKRLLACNRRDCLIFPKKQRKRERETRNTQSDRQIYGSWWQVFEEGEEEKRVKTRDTLLIRRRWKDMTAWDAMGGGGSRAQSNPQKSFKFAPPPYLHPTKLSSSFHTHALGVERGGVVAGEGTFGPLKRGLKGVVSQGGRALLGR